MISTREIKDLFELRELVTRLKADVKVLEGERDDQEAAILEKMQAGQQPEKNSPYRVQRNKVDKRYTPSYRDCAIALAGKAKVDKWVSDHHPHEKTVKLEISNTVFLRIRFSRGAQAVLDALASLFPLTAKAKTRKAA